MSVLTLEWDQLPVFGNAYIVCLRSQFVAREQAVVDCLHVDDSNGRVGRIADGDDILDAHRDGPALVELRFAAVENDRIGIEPIERPFDRIVPDRITGDKASASAGWQHNGTSASSAAFAASSKWSG